MKLLAPGTEVYLLDGGHRYARATILRQDKDAQGTRRYYWIDITQAYDEFSRAFVVADQEFTTSEDQIELVDPLTLLAELAE